MRRRFYLLFAVGVILSGAINTMAQTPTQPPKVLSIFREEVKASRNGAHEKLEAEYVKALQKAKWPTYSLALRSIAGPNDVWFTVGYSSFEEMEKDNANFEKHPEVAKEFERLDALDAEYRASQRGIVAVYREDLSYNAAVNLPQMRYFEVLTMRARPGHEMEFEELAKLYASTLKKVNRAEDHYATYQVMAGMPAGTYLIFVPRKSLKEMDNDLDPKNQMAFMSALGEDGAKKIQKLAADAILTGETSIYAFSPRMSYVSDEFAKAGGEDFWRPKPMMAMKPAPKKPADKTTATKQR